MAGPKVTVGSVEIISLLDTPMEFDWKMFFPNNQPADFEPYRGHYPGSYGDGKFRTYCHCYVLRSQGHTILLVSSGGERALVAGDLAHHPAQVDRTDWCSGFDTAAAAAVTTRQKVFDQLEADGLLGMFCHFPNPGYGKLVRLEGKRVWQAL